MCVWCLCVTGIQKTVNLAIPGALGYVVDIDVPDFDGHL